MGYAWDYRHPADIMDDCASISPLLAGVTYERLAGWQSLLWPVDADGTDSPYLYRDSFPHEDGKAKLYPLEWRPPAETSDDDYPFMLDNGRLLEHFQGMNQSGRSEGTLKQVPEWFVEVGTGRRERWSSKTAAGFVCRLVAVVWRSRSAWPNA